MSETYNEPTKTCPFCDKGTTDCMTNKTYCLRTWFRVMLFMRPVAPNHTCKHFKLRDKFKGYGR